MGATNCPETPRQKMISMMYLVLTAMLALNVSVEILNGYSLVEGSLRQSIDIAENRNKALITRFDNLVDQNPNDQRTKAMKSRSEEVIAESNSLYNFIDEIKKRIISKVDRSKADTTNMKISEGGRSDLNITGEVGMINKKGIELRNRINKFSEFLQDLVEKDSARRVSIAGTFETKDRIKEGELHTWERGIFDGMPAIATLTVLSKIQNDIRNAEAEVIQYLISQIDAEDFRVNKIEALVIPNSNYIMKGSTFTAQIILAASDSTRKLEIEVNGKPLESNIFEVRGAPVGKHSFSGKIWMTRPNGERQFYDFTNEFRVAEPSATISADMMNVFYAGIKNPVSVSVPGVAAGDVEISVTNATQVRTSKGWDISPSKVGVESVISVVALIDGKKIPMGSKPFRVKPLPPPLAKLKFSDVSKTPFKGGAIEKNLLVTATHVIAELDDADLDVKYTVLSFSLNYNDSMGNTLVEQATGSELTSKQTGIFRSLVRGKTVYITNTQAKGPDGITRRLPPVDIALK